MQYAESILDLVGDTPLVRLSRVTRDLGPADRQPLILAKLEMLNPGGSVKDRIGLPMIEAAERAGLLKPGGTIIEPTSRQHRSRARDRGGAQGLSLHLRDGRQAVDREAAAPPGVRGGGRPVPDERRPRDRPRATTRSPPGSPETSPARSSPTSTGTRRTRPPTSGPPGPRSGTQTEGRITHFVASVGTGGTITGAARYLKAQQPDDRVIGADPEGSVLSGDTARPYLTEGVGEDFFPGTYDPAVVDRWVRVSDRDAFAMARRLTREEGILAGESCGTAIVAALTRSPASSWRDGEAGRTRSMVVLLADGGRELPLEALQRRVDAGERPAADDRGRRRGSAICSRTATTAAPMPDRRARPDDGAGRRRDRAAPGVRHQPAAGVRGRRGRRPRRASSGRSARRASSTGRTATRRSSSGPSAR